MSERTEAPTPRRREEAHRKGQVAKSIEINSAAILLASFWLLSVTGPGSVETLRTLMQRSFTALASPPFLSAATNTTADLTFNTLRTGGLAVGQLTLQTVAPLIGTLMLVGVAANLAQVGVMFSQEVFKPDFNRVNPVPGLKRIFSGRVLVELLKSLLKLSVISLVVYITLRDNSLIIASTSRMSLSGAASNLSQVAITIGLRVSLAMLVLAAADYLFQRREFEKSLRMTRQEVIEEMKRYENPQLKARIRSRQRQLAMNRMMAAVPKADVVITNPTHLAIALAYEQGKMRAPQVVAKGERLVAERIKEKAGEHHVPLVENKPLARALFKSVDIGQEVPLDLYQAVAEVLAFVFRLKAGHKLTSRAS
jgi:flagellar biosynthetic protein FlhB